MFLKYFVVSKIIITFAENINDMPIPKVKLSKQTLKLLAKIEDERNVYEFIRKAEIPNSAYYMAVNGGAIKETHYNKILSALKVF